MKKTLNKIAKYAAFVFATIALIGLLVFCTLLLIMPNAPIGNLVYVTLVPFYTGWVGFMISFVYHVYTK